MAVISDNKEQGMSLYLDGELKETVPWTGIPSVCSSQATVSIGSYDHAFDGLLRDASLWNAVLNHEEAIQLYYHTPAREIRSESLIGSWPCDEGEGDTLQDLSPGQIKHPGKSVVHAVWKKVYCDLAFEETHGIPTVPPDEEIFMK